MSELTKEEREKEKLNDEEIHTQRGGIIDTIIHRRKEFDGYLHYIMPMKNTKNEVRFYLRSLTGHQVLENVIRKRSNQSFDEYNN